jgi:DNA adenine methylase
MSTSEQKCEIKQPSKVSQVKKAIRKIKIADGYPVVKWVGGKTQILDKVFKLFPLELKNYHEPFVGGGSVLFELLNRVKSGKITLTGKVFAYDYNATLISMYKHIQSVPVELFKALNKIVRKYNNCSQLANKKDLNRKAHSLKDVNGIKENYYYWIRHCYNNLEDGTVKRSAMFIFLNKTCFRGVFREGPNGFNVPYGNYKTSKFPTKRELCNLSRLLKEVIFEQSDFRNSIANVEVGDFCYLDPPYAKETKTSFVGYNARGFGEQDHKDLFKLCNGLRDDGKRFLMSNACVSDVLSAFPEDKFTIEKINCKRSINSKNPGAKTTEVLIYF